MRRVLVAALLALLLTPSASRAEDPLEHVVQPGESLWQIAARLGGDPQLWPLLYRANRDQIKDPSRLYPGQSLRIPDFRPQGNVAGAPLPGSSASPVRH